MPTTRSTRSSNSSGKASNASSKAAKQTARKNTQSSAEDVVPSSGISMAAFAIYQMVQAQIDAKKKALKDAEDAAIRSRNQELLEAEGGSDVEASAPARKKNKTSQRPVLSDDEEEMAAGLRSICATASGTKGPQGGQEETSSDAEEETSQEPVSRGEDEEDPELLADLEGIDVDEADVDMDLGSGGGNLSNEIGVEGQPLDVLATMPLSKQPKTPRSKASVATPSNTSKVVEKDFTPRTLRLALAAKSHIRTRTVYDEPFPRNNKIARINFAWQTIQESARASSELEVRRAYKRATKDVAVKSKLTKFTLYGRTGLISSIISKARDKVRAFYGLNGDPDMIRKDVEWLLKDSHFVYGGINLKDRSVDQMKPFGCQLIVDIIEAQWFPSTSRSKLDLETTNKIYERRDLPLNVLLLSVTAIEHALKEWSATGRKACQITFSEDTAKQSYERHLGHWKFFEAQMKAWPAWFKRTTLAQILANHSNFDINADENDFAGLDFSALDSLAGYREEQENMTAGIQMRGTSESGAELDTPSVSARSNAQDSGENAGGASGGASGSEGTEGTE